MTSHACAVAPLLYALSTLEGGILGAATPASADLGEKEGGVEFEPSAASVDPT